MRGNLSTVWRGAGRLALLAMAVLLACDRPARVSGAAIRASVAADSMGAAPTAVSVVPLHARPELAENSAAVMSRRQPGVLFTINDSDNDPLLFALDTSGADRGVWRVSGASNVDWESAALGPCAAAARADSCIYIGDTGDNDARHRTRAIYRVAEPPASATPGFTGEVAAERLTYMYPDGPHDVEAMFVTATGDMFLITKRPLRGRDGNLRPALMYRIPAAAWGSPLAVVAQLHDSLPIVPGSAPLRVITDASLSPDGRRLAVRTYTQTFVLAIDPESAHVDRGVTPAACNIVSLGERQGEGLSWIDDAGRFAFTSEGRTSPLVLASCPVPVP